MTMSILRRGLALLPLFVVLSACGESPTSPDAALVDGAPSLAVAALAPIEALEGTPVQFYCGTSSDAEGDALTCRWDLDNDGIVEATCTTANGICVWDFNHDGLNDGSRAGSFDYAWPDQGAHTVRLTVTDATGQASSATAPVTVADVVPTFWGRQPLFLATGQTQRFNTRFFDPGRDGTWRWVFDFGDGASLTGRGTPGTGFGQSHAYSAAGEYNVTVTVTDKDGVSASFTRVAVVVDNDAPVADAGGPYVTTEGVSLLLSSAATIDDQTELTYSWDFGDGTRSIAANPSKLYRDNGNFVIRLIVKDPTGTADTAYTSVEVVNRAPTGMPRVPVVREGSSYVISMAGQDAAVDRLTLQYSFDCGQGTGPSAWSTVGSLTCPALPDQGTVVATYSVRDKDGAVTHQVRTINVTNVAPVPTLTATSATTIPIGGTVSVDARWTDAGANDGPFAYRLTWGDSPIAATGVEPGTMTTTPLSLSHTYTRAGTFLITLFVTDKDGLTPRSNQITVTVTP